MRARANDLRGIVNGIDSVDYNPDTDKNIVVRYNYDNVLEKKIHNKRAIQAELGLAQDDNRFMIGIVSRLTDQKGFDLIAYMMERMCEQGIQFVVLGTGEQKYEDMFRWLKTGLAGLTAEECDLLENYVLKWDIHGQTWLRDEDWTENPDGYGAPWNDRRQAVLTQGNQLRRRVREP